MHEFLGTFPLREWFFDWEEIGVLCDVAFPNRLEYPKLLARQNIPKKLPRQTRSQFLKTAIAHR